VVARSRLGEFDFSNEKLPILVLDVIIEVNELPLGVAIDKALVFDPSNVNFICKRSRFYKDRLVSNTFEYVPLLKINFLGETLIQIFTLGTREVTESYIPAVTVLP
jgi:hypothetical protein